jgi:hypothetical protein
VIRKPTTDINDIKDSVLDIINLILSFYKFELKRMSINAIASGTVSFTLSSNRLRKIDGAVQIACSFTAAETPLISYAGSGVNVVYNFSADTNGSHYVTFLLIGS